MSASNSIKPLFTHDCPRCIFLGRLQEMDAYCCVHDDDSGTSYILRFSSEVVDYASQRDYRNRHFHNLELQYGFGPSSRNYYTEAFLLYLRRRVLIELLSPTIANMMEGDSVND